MIRLKCIKKNGKLKKRNNEVNKLRDIMSYSRWIDSKFYTYWAGNNKVYSKKDEVFIVHGDLERYRAFTYTECKHMIEDTIRIKGKMNFVDNDEEAEELKGYMKQFIESVDHHYLTEIRGGQ